MTTLTLKQIAYNKIKDKIITCEYKPNSIIIEETLSSELKMSRTPIRDALVRLEQERLVKLIPKKGYSVAPLTYREITMVFEGRLLLEPYFIETYCTDIPAEVIKKMEYITKQYEIDVTEHNLDKFFEDDDEFHKCIVSQCTNNYLLDAYQSLENQDRRFRTLSTTSIEQRQIDTIIEHKHIVSALKDNNIPLAAKMMRKHLENSRTSVFDLILHSQFDF